MATAQICAPFLVALALTLAGCGPTQEKARQPGPGGAESSRMGPSQAGGLAEGENCTTTGSRGLRPKPCAEGLVCNITDPGHPEVDLPDRGTCVPEAAASKAPAALGLGAECTTSGTRGFPPVPCAEGLECRITDKGHPEVDMPNRGTCQPPAALRSLLHMTRASRARRPAATFAAGPP
mmetsp:Transcript_3699/g.11646  ORF Transcript_3699/g.11646 Transcript_3699/m.11646 type:complete len:179 (-) Transcript_3699:68-604(-)